jgi:chemotaxis protein CheX
MDISEQDLQVFIDTVIHYFDQTTSEAAEVDTPYIKDEENVVLDFTGVIGISGKTKGAIYFTANADLLADLLKATGHTEDIDSELLQDMVGEVANTLSGNARRSFGSNFMISVPVVLKGAEAIRLPASIKTFVIPIIWRNYRSYLIVCLE